MKSAEVVSTGGDTRRNRYELGPLPANLVTPNGKLLRILERHTDLIWVVAWSSDSSRLASSSYSEDQTIRIWDADDGTLLHTLESERAAKSQAAPFLTLSHLAISVLDLAHIHRLVNSPLFCYTHPRWDVGETSIWEEERNRCQN